MLLSLGILIFVIVFYCMITEKVASAYATMLGALAMAFLGIVNEEQILETIHSRLEILLLLIGMMIIVSLISETGVFQWFAIKVVKIVRGDPLKLLILLSIVTATCSAFLDNVTTILLMAPVSILLAKQLKLDPFPFVMTEVLSSDIGGMATLIGDPTQLIIGSEGKLSFNEFLINTAPMTIIALVILLLVRNKLAQSEVFAAYLILYGVERFIVEGMRTDSLYIGSLRVSQVLSLVFVVGSLIYLIVLNTKFKDKKILYRES